MKHKSVVGQGAPLRPARGKLPLRSAAAIQSLLMRMALIAIALTACVAYAEKPKSQGDTREPNPANKVQQADVKISPAIAAASQNKADRQEDSQPIKAPGYFSRLFAPENLPNVALVLVGMAGIAAAIFTLKAIQRQTTTMHGQLTEMGTQTAILGRSVAHAEKSADAAKQSADTLTTIERAWVHLELRTTSKQNFVLAVRNTGRTPAKIVSLESKFDFPPDVHYLFGKLPDYLDPNHAKGVFAASRPLPVGSEWIADSFDLSFVTQSQWREIQALAKALVFYGRLEYQVVFDEPVRETRFCFVYSYTKDEFRFDGPAEYTKYT